MIIGVDIDDTITDSWEAVIPYYSKMFNISEEELHKSKPYHNSISHLISREEYYKVMVPVYDEAIPRVNLKKHVKETIDKLYELGCKVIFITSRGIDHTDPYKDSKDYLDKYHIKYEKIIIGASNKAKVCQEENVSIFIDDSIRHCQEVSELGIDTLLFEAYYNKDYDGVKHVKSWDEIYEYIKGRCKDEE